jgi:hypothetical protein
VGSEDEQWAASTTAGRCSMVRWLFASLVGASKLANSLVARLLSESLNEEENAGAHIEE